MNECIGDSSGNEEYHTCAACSADCDREIFDGGMGVASGFRPRAPGTACTASQTR